MGVSFVFRCDLQFNHSIHAADEHLRRQIKRLYLPRLQAGTAEVSPLSARGVPDLNRVRILLFCWNTKVLNKDIFYSQGRPVVEVTGMTQRQRMCVESGRIRENGVAAFEAQFVNHIEVLVALGHQNGMTNTVPSESFFYNVFSSPL